jgi:hypothetical protein
MNPLEAVNYMKDTGKTVKPERIPPWIDNPQWINWYYKINGDNIQTLYVGEVFIQETSITNWLNWWMNFCYNNSTNETELLPV